MKIEVLQYFTVLAESRSISEAAQKLYIAQPSLTKSLQLFEKELGFSLFERSRDGITLTPEGKKILPQAKKMVEYYESWLELGHQNTLSRIDIFAGRSFADFLLPHILVEFSQKYPDLPVNYIISVMPGEHISRSIQKPTIALLSCNDQELQIYTKVQGNPPIILTRGESRCLLSSTNSLARKPFLEVQDIKEMFLVLPGTRMDASNIPSVGSDISTEILSTIRPDRRIFIGALSNVISQVAENPQTFALSFYPTLCRYERIRNGELTAVPFKGRIQETNLCLFYSKKALRQHPQMMELITAIRKSFKQFEEGL